MKAQRIYFLVILLILSACEDVINPKLDSIAPVVVVDAWLTDLPEPQTITLSQSQDYFDNGPLEFVEGATVSLVRNGSTEMTFAEGDPGRYVWNPAAGETLGNVGDAYELRVTIGTETYTSQSVMNRVPQIDSIAFRFEEENLVFPDSFFGEVFARDFVGSGDTYWIKAYKNGVYLNQPDEINIAYDAGFSAGGNVDGLVFIRPIRDGINPIDQDENDEFISPYSPGDSVLVEIHSITNDAFDYLNEVRIQIDRQGGFGELFATPVANVPTNIVPTNNQNQVVLGFFCTSAVASMGKRFED